MGLIQMLIYNFSVMFTRIICASGETMSSGFANNKGADQPAHPLTGQHLCCAHLLLHVNFNVIVSL